MRSKDPLISVYITNYNYAAYIRQSIRSVLEQSLQDVELIIIDDGSTDNSKEIIEEYRNLDGVSIIYQLNKGLNISNNVAMRVAKGKYLMRLDADDYLVPDALEKMVAVLEAKPELGLVFPDYYYVDAEGQITGQEMRHNFEEEVSLYDQPAHGACTLIRLSFLKKVGGYNESFTCQDGYDLWLKFITHYSVTNINEPLFYYRRHGNNLTTNEERILETRRQIKKSFLDLQGLENSTVLVIPVRNTRLKGISLPLHLFSGRSLLERKVESALASSVIRTVYIISEDEEVLSFGRSRFDGESSVRVMPRSQHSAGPNQSLGATVELAFQDMEVRGESFGFIMTAAVESPFVPADVFDDAIHTIKLFGSDAVLSVRPDNKTYYQHTGHRLQPILDQDQFTRLEREALYKGAGGIMASTRQSFADHRKVNAGVITHVIVDDYSAFSIQSEFDLRVFQALLIEEEAREPSANLSKT